MTQLHSGDFQRLFHGVPGLWGQEKDRQQARDAGFDHHLVKPAEIGALKDLLASLG